MEVSTRSYMPVLAPKLQGIPSLVESKDLERFDWIRWSGTTLWVMAHVVEAPDRSDGVEQPRHQIVVANANGKGELFMFGTIWDGDGYRITSGALSRDQNITFARYVRESMKAGEVPKNWRDIVNGQS